MVTLWLWDADGPHGSASGVTGDPATARRAAKKSMAATGAATATVQQATLLGGGGWMRSGYSLTGTGWTAKRNGNRIRWTPLTHPSKQAAS
jgi:hypothetical protein